MEKETIIRLGLSEIYNGYSEEIINKLKNEIEFVNFYPETECNELKQALSEKYGIEKKCFYVGNGLDEIIISVLLGLNILNKRVIISSNTFLGYHNSAKLLENEVTEIPNRENHVDIDAITDKLLTEGAELIYLCNPHNPLGTILERNRIERLLQVCNDKKTYLVVDEAYIEFLENPKLIEVMDLINKSDRLLVLRTFSKAYGLAGLRCGYVCANEKIIFRINSVKDALPFSVNSLAQKAAILALKDERRLSQILKTNYTNRRWTQNKLKELGIPFVESYTNFVSFKINKPKELCEFLNREFSIVVKNLEGMGMNGWIRVSIGKKEHMELFIKALESFLLLEKKIINTGKEKGKK